jgi:ATP-dependent protease HslVU (ClpYQ) peptidase subunit
MTCIVGIREKNRIVIGADSLGSNGFTKTIRHDKKVFINNGMIFGFTSSFRMGQILEYSFVPPEQSRKENDFKYLVNTFIPALIETYSKKSYLRKSSDQAVGGEFLLGYKNKLYKIEGDFQVGIAADEFDACGCGENFALGSLHTTKHLKLDLTSEERIKLAINAAAEYSSGVGGPIKIMTLES